jgi:putative ATP-binding cassette transporter
MQTAKAFEYVEGALSFFRNAYDDFTSYRAVLNRLSGFLDSMDAAGQLHTVQIEEGDQRIALENLTVRTPANITLVENLNLALPQASTLLVRGKSGVGKTTLLRSIAGLWPYVDGKVERPIDEQALFLSQKPYIPLGTLRKALYYPGIMQTDDQAAAILTQCHLGHLVARLDEEADWTQILSLGEQQRLAIGRVLLNRPQIVFLDEASSAMDEGLEHAMYSLLRLSLPDAILVSVGHRSSLLGFHAQELELLEEGRWRMQDI